MPRKREGARLKGLQKGGHLWGDQQQAGSGYDTENWETQDDWNDDEDGDGDDDMSALSDSLTRAQQAVSRLPPGSSGPVMTTAMAK